MSLEKKLSTKEFRSGNEQTEVCSLARTCRGVVVSVWLVGWLVVLQLFFFVSGGVWLSSPSSSSSFLSFNLHSQQAGYGERRRRCSKLPLGEIEGPRRAVS